VLVLQFGGAAGTLASLREAAPQVTQSLAKELGLAVPTLPWHTQRDRIAETASLFGMLIGTLGKIARDISLQMQTEIDELAEPAAAGKGGSSTMPHKRNPTLSILVRRAALAAPQLAATLHLAAADSVDERAAGAWHAEWATVAILVRRTVIAASQTTDLITGLRVNADRMAATLGAADVGSEQRSMAELAGREPRGDYRGASDEIIDATLERARRSLKAEEDG
jgi:3-carboxy-cis,cis-muconate cycloisomerase